MSSPSLFVSHGSPRLLIVGGNAVPQVARWKTGNFGAFIQSNIKLGPYPVFGSN